MIDILETAKRLKEAGFTQGGGGEAIIRSHGRVMETADWETYEEAELDMDQYIYLPTLSELIEACGKSFDRLEKVYWKDYPHWRAYMTEKCFEAERQKYPDYCDIDCDGYGSGKTPKGAVTELYLALKEKKK